MVVSGCAMLTSMLRNGSRNLDDENIARVRRFRTDASASEKVAWELLRKRRLGGFLFRRQHPVGPYALDFYCAEAKVCVEIDGGQHVLRSREDEARDLALERLGILTIRIPSLLLFEGDGLAAQAAFGRVEAACRARCRRRD